MKNTNTGNKKIKSIALVLHWNRFEFMKITERPMLFRFEISYISEKTIIEQPIYCEITESCVLTDKAIDTVKSLIEWMNHLGYNVTQINCKYLNCNVPLMHKLPIHYVYGKIVTEEIYKRQIAISKRVQCKEEVIQNITIKNGEKVRSIFYGLRNRKYVIITNNLKSPALDIINNYKSAGLSVSNLNFQLCQILERTRPILSN